jgi:hypothetical protein
MKTPVAMTAVIAVIAVAAGLVACGGTHRRGDWHKPSPAAGPASACATDADCQGAPCAIELGATQGTCQPVDLVGPPGPHRADGGAHPLPPGHPPLIQPSPSDIQI